MARRQKISQMNPKGANLQATDLLEVSVLTGTGYDTYSITGQQIINAGGGGGSQDLQQVTDIGSITTNSITITSGVNEATTVSGIDIKTENTLANTYVTLRDTGEIALKTGGEESSLQNTNVSNPGVILEFPDKPTGSYTIATEDDYVPYIGATTDVDLDTFGLDAKFIKIKGTGGNGHLNLKHQSSDATAGGSESVLYADNSGNPKWKNDGNTVQNVMLENSAITGETKTKITYDSKGLITAGQDLTSSDILGFLGWFKTIVTTNSTAVTGTTSETIASSTQLATLSNGTIFKINTLRITKGAVAGSTIRAYISPNNNNLTGAVQILATGSVIVTGVRLATISRIFKIEGGNIKGFNSATGVMNDNGTSTVVGLDAALPSGTLYLIVTITNLAVGESTTQELLDISNF